MQHGAIQGKPEYAFEVVDVGGDEELRVRLTESMDRKTVPLVFLDGRLLRGFDEIRALEHSGELDRLVSGGTQARKPLGSDRERAGMQLHPGPFVAPSRSAYGLVVKVQLFCWASELPATSFDPVVSTPLYLVFLASRVVFVPKGLSVALSPSELRLTTTSVICVWVPPALTLKSLKVVVLWRSSSSPRRWPSGRCPVPRSWSG